jgi:hypothetical protein
LPAGRNEGRSRARERACSWLAALCFVEKTTVRALEKSKNDRLMNGSRPEVETSSALAWFTVQAQCGSTLVRGVKERL